MTPEEALQVADDVLIVHVGNPLTDIQRMILRESLADKCYESMKGYASQHIKNEGKALWDLLSEALGERVRKKNFKGALEKRLKAGQEALVTDLPTKLLRVADKNANLAEDRLITERFSKAIEQLAHQEPLVNMGAIYALEKIAQEPPSSYHWIVMELLSAYIREKSPITPNTLDNQPEGSEPTTDAGETERCPSNIQAALTVIGHRNIEYDPPSQAINLMHTNLRGANLREAKLSDANLSNCDLRQTDLCGAVLIGADLRATDFSGAVLTDTNCSQAMLAEAKFRNAQLRTVDFEGADLKKTDFSQARINKSKFRNAILAWTNFTEATCVEIDLSRIRFFYHTIFHKARLVQANFSSPYVDVDPLRAVDFSGAMLRGANFTNSKLACIITNDQIYPVNFSSACLADVSFKGAVIFKETDFTQADVENADFQDVIGLTRELIEVAENWQKARYSPDIRKRLGLPPMEDANA